MKTLVVATKNTGKFKEIKSILGDEFYNLRSLRDFSGDMDISEGSNIYLENALKKARKVGDRFGKYTVADDSGLEVEALDGRPGVYSSRYGKDDRERIDRLLSELDGVPWERRRAVFKAYVVFYIPETERSYVFYGSLKGYIGFEKKGESGFGFDPVFYIPEKNKYVAELAMDEKNSVSHRGRAFLALKRFLNVDFF